MQCEGISRKFLHPTAMETLVGDRSRPVGLGSAELEAASHATQLESRRSLVPEKLRSTRVSLSTLGHVHSWVHEVALNVDAALATPLSAN